MEPFLLSSSMSGKDKLILDVLIFFLLSIISVKTHLGAVEITCCNNWFFGILERLIYFKE